MQIRIDGSEVRRNFLAVSVKAPRVGAIIQLAISDNRHLRVPAKVTAVQTYEWMPGGFFLVHREFARFGDVEHKTMTIIGYDPSSQTYPVHFFDNLGYYRVYQARVHDRTWTFTGKYERATIVFGADGNTFKSTWERSSDGSNWLPLCELKGTKAR